MSGADLVEHHGALADQALRGPVTLAEGGQDRLVLVSAEEFARLRRSARRSRLIEGLAEAKVAAIAKTRVPPGHEALNRLLGES